MAKKQPRPIFVQSHVALENGKAVLQEFEATHTGLSLALFWRSCERLLFYFPVSGVIESMVARFGCKSKK
jgi:hypothetical protein